MKNKNTYPFAILLLLLVWGCKPTQYHIKQTHAHSTQINTTDSAFAADSAILKLIAPYKSKLDVKMNEVVGIAETDLVKNRPNGNLNNFIADIIKTETSKKIGVDIDFAFTNLSGLRIPSISKGNITVGKLYELMPFDNMIIAAKINGETLRQVLEKIASKGGEAIAGFEMVISTDNKLLSATYNSAPVNFNKDYVIATNDFLFYGGDGYTMFGDNVLTLYPIAIPIRDMVIEHIKKLTATQVPINPKADERTTIR